MKKTYYIIISFLLLILPLFLYWKNIGNYKFLLSKNGEDWSAYATYFGGIYGPIISLIALYFLIEQLKLSSDTLKNTQETSNFSFVTFEIKTLVKRIEYFNSIDLSNAPAQWIATFKLITYDLNYLTNNYKNFLINDTARNTIQTILSHTAKWFLKENFSKYQSNISLFYTEQISIAKEMNLKEIDILLDKLQISILQSVPETKPEYF